MVEILVKQCQEVGVDKNVVNWGWGGVGGVLNITVNDERHSKRLKGYPGAKS